MKILKYVFVVVIIVGSFAYAGMGLFEYSKNPCKGTIEYSIGTLDSEFGLSREDFRKYLEESHKVWNDALGREAFVYKEEASFKVNLIFDQRQMDTIQKQKTESGLSSAEDKLRQLDNNLRTANINYDNRILVFERETINFEDRKNQYEKDVVFWNDRGGAPENEYRRLQNEAQYLNSEVQRLNNEASAINRFASEINDLLRVRNDAAREYNKVVDLYNKRYGKGVEFHQAEYTGGNINIYQFSGRKDLMVAMIHEFGHALGLDHVDEPSALMYYLTGGNNEVRLELTEADLEEMRRVCKL